MTNCIIRNLPESQWQSVVIRRQDMELWQARQVCPEIIFVPPRMELYLRFSRMAQEIYSEYTDQRGFMYQDKILAQLNAKEHMIHPQAYFHG